jgi:hypothetical protein
VAYCLPEGGGPPEGAVGKLIGLPFRVLLEPVVMAAFRAVVTHTSASAIQR